MQPIWMLAATGMIIPVLIHLWNLRQGRIYKVGSIVFLTQYTKKYSSSFKITEILLLLLRCLLILLLALLLAKPQWNQSFPAGKEKGWVMMEKEYLPATYNNYKPVIDSLLQAGYEFHYFNAGFNKDKLQDAFQSTTDRSHRPVTSYRLLLKQLDAAVPASLPVYLFTTNYLNRFTGRREPVSLNLHWSAYTPADSTDTFISSAYLISADSIRVIAGNSKPSGTVYTNTDISIKKNVSPVFHISTSNSGIMIACKDQEPPVLVDTTRLRVTIFAGKYSADASYIEAALKAIRQFSNHQLEITVINKPEATPASQDWLFWLSELPIPVNIHSKNIFTYQEGTIKNTSSWINTSTAISGNGEMIGLYKLIESSQSNDPLGQLWQDGFGNTVLTKEATDVNRYRLFTHIDPSWNNLPWSSEFPQLIFSLLYPSGNTNVSDIHDKRIIAEQQLQPGMVLKNGGPVSQKLITTDISHACWLLVFVVFCMERLLALKNRKEEGYA